MPSARAASITLPRASSTARRIRAASTSLSGTLWLDGRGDPETRPGPWASSCSRRPDHSGTSKAGRCARAASNRPSVGTAKTSLQCIAACCGMRPSMSDAARLAPMMRPSSSTQTSPSLSSPSTRPGQFRRSSMRCGREVVSAFSMLRADCVTRCLRAGCSATSTPVRSSMPTQWPSGPQIGAPAQLKAPLSWKKCSPRCSQTGSWSVSVVPMAVVPTARSERSTPTRAMAAARGLLRSTGPSTSITVPRASVRMAK